METNYGMLEHEKLLLEKENSYLKQRLLGGEYDTQREDAKMQQLKHERDEALSKLQNMEDDLLSILESDETKDSTKKQEKIQKESAKQERGMDKWHELETKLVQTEASLAAAQEKVNKLTEQEEQFLQQLQDMSGELEHSREQHQAEITSLRQELQNKTAEEAKSKIMQLQQEQVQQNEAVLQKSKDEMAAKEQQCFAEIARLNEAMKTADDETTNTIEALQNKVRLYIIIVTNISYITNTSCCR